MTYPTITALPTPPSRQRPSVFVPEADAFLGALPTLRTEVNAAGEFVETKAGEADADAATASAAADAAELSKTIAQTAVNYRGDYDAGTTYQIGESVSYEGKVYAAKTVNTGVTPVDGANWLDITLADIRTPVITSPTAEETGVLPTPTIVGDSYAPLYSVDTRAHRLFQIDLASGDFSAPVVSEEVNSDSFTVTSNLALETNHKVRIKDVSVTGAESNFSEVIVFQTANITVDAPTLTVEGSPDEVPETPTLTTGAFATTPSDEDTHESTNWIVRLAADDTIVYQSLADTGNLLSIEVPEGNLLENTEYKFQVQHIGATYGASAVTEVVATTVDSYGPTVIGEAFGGGFYAGNIVEGGVEYYVIVAPKSSGESSSQQFKTSQTASPAATQTLNDGPAATSAMVTAGSHPAAAFCDGLTIGGFSDWYLPARDELELCYRNLKPTTNSNDTSDRPKSSITYPEGDDLSADTMGVNRNSSPTGSAYTTGDPAQTSVTDFVDGGTEAFASANYWSSSEYSDTLAWLQVFNDGFQGNGFKDTSNYVRAVRRLPV